MQAFGAFNYGSRDLLRTAVWRVNGREGEAARKAKRGVQVATAHRYS